MDVSVVNKSRRRGVFRRAGAAGLALAAVLGLGACKADGGGFIGAPLDSGPVAVYDGDATFGFNFTCHMDRQDRAVIRGQITYHDSAASTIDVPVDPDVPAGPAVATEFPEIRLHGRVDPLFVEDVSTCEQAARAFPDGALFEGAYHPQGKTPSIPDTERGGRFIVEVFDQGEPARPGGDFTGDSFAIELVGGAYGAYTRAGYIEGGNVQVRGNSR